MENSTGGTAAFSGSRRSGSGGKSLFFLFAAISIAFLATGCDNGGILKAQAATSNEDAVGSLSKLVNSGYDPITDIYILTGDNNSIQPPAPYTKISSGIGYSGNGDLNQGAKGKYIYLCYTRNKNYGPPITGIYVYSGKNSTHYPNPGYFHAHNSSGYNPLGDRGADLNKGAGGDFIYLLVTRDKSKSPFWCLVTEAATRKLTDLNRYGVKWLPNDLNENAGGRFIYIGYADE
jgi:hypothetical protein